MFRGLFALRAGLEGKWRRLERERGGVVVVRPGVAGVGRKGSESSEDSGAKVGLRGERERGEGGRGGEEVRPWRISQDGVRSLVDVGVAGVGYLL